MSPQSPIVPFRANEQDRERLDYLKRKKSKKAAQVIREALQRLYESEKRKDK